MKPTDKWLIDVNAIASSEGWRHPKTNELLKAMKLDIDQPIEPVDVDETETVDEPTSETVDTEQDVTVAVAETETVEPIVTVDETEVKDTVETKPEINEDESGKVKTSKTRTKKQK